jgi:hypothetical protein
MWILLNENKKRQQNLGKDIRAKENIPNANYNLKNIMITMTKSLDKFQSRDDRENRDKIWNLWERI